MDEFKNLALFFLAAILMAFLCIGVKITTSDPTANYGDTITVKVFDTILCYKPTPKDSTVINYVTVKLPVADNNLSNIDSDKSHDSCSVTIPVTQKIYTDDSTFTAYISGYNTSLDSMLIFHQRQQTIIQVPPHPPPQKTSRWSVSVHVGYGITMSSTPQFTPYIGIGLSYKIFNF